jgi:hypothetical protein
MAAETLRDTLYILQKTVNSPSAFFSKNGIRRNSIREIKGLGHTVGRLRRGSTSRTNNKENRKTLS